MYLFEISKKLENIKVRQHIQINCNFVEFLFQNMCKNSCAKCLNNLLFLAYMYKGTHSSKIVTTNRQNINFSCSFRLEFCNM